MKRLNKKGFTMAELLIVVAIIAVLVAIAIPVFTAQLNRSKYATDVANARSMYAELSADYLANQGQTYTVSASSVTAGTPTSIEVKSGTTTVDTFKFNGMADITITPGTATNGPKVEVAACTYNNNTAEVFGN